MRKNIISKRLLNLLICIILVLASPNIGGGTLIKAQDPNDTNTPLTDVLPSTEEQPSSLSPDTSETSTESNASSPANDSPNTTEPNTTDASQTPKDLDNSKVTVEPENLIEPTIIESASSYSIRAVLDRVNAPVLTPILANLTLIDSSGNEVVYTNPPPVRAVFYHMGREIASAPCAWQQGKIYRFIMPEVSAIQVTVLFEVKLNSTTTLYSNSSTLVIIEDEYFRFLILDPAGKPSNGGEVKLYYDYKDETVIYPINSDGIVTLRKDSIISSPFYPIYIAGNSFDSNDIFLFRDNLATTKRVYSMSSPQKLNITSVKPNNTDIINGVFEVRLADTIMIENNFTGAAGWNKYSSVNIWIGKNQYFSVSLKLNSDSNNDYKYYLIAPNIHQGSITPVVLDGTKVADIRVEGKASVDKIDYTIGSIRYFSAQSNQFFISSSIGTLNYTLTKRDNDQTLQYYGKLQIASGVISIVRFGKNFRLLWDYPTASISPYYNLSISLIIQDEFNNSVIYSGSIPLSVRVKQSGTVKYSLDSLKSTGIPSYPYYTFNIPIALTGTVQVQFSGNIGGAGPFESVDYNLNIDPSNCYKISIRDPLGKPAKGGKIHLFSIYNGSSQFRNQINIGLNGDAYIKHSDISSGLQYRMTIVGYTQDLNEAFVSQHDYYPATTIYMASNCKRVAVKMDLPVNHTTEYMKLICRQGFYSFDVIEKVAETVSNLNFWTAPGIYDYFTQLSLKNINGEEILYDLSLEGFDITNKSELVMDTNNVSRIIPVYEGPLNGFISSYNIRHSYGYSRSYNPAQKVYATRKLYSQITARFRLGNGSASIDFEKFNFIAKDSEARFSFGRTISMDELSCTSYIQAGGSYDFSLYRNTTYEYRSPDSLARFSKRLITINFLQNGKLIKSVYSTLYNSGNNSYCFANVPNLSDGIYEIESFIEIPGSGNLIINREKAVVYSKNNSFTVTANDLSNGRLIIHDYSNVVVDLSLYGKSAYIPKNMLISGAYYYLFFSGTKYINNEHVNYSYQAPIQFKSDISDYVIFEPLNLQLIEIGETPKSYIEFSSFIPNSNKVAQQSKLYVNANGICKVMTQPGDYCIGTIKHDAGKTYVLEKFIKLQNSPVKILFDYNNLCQIKLYNNFENSCSDILYNITSVRGGNSYKLRYSDTENNSVYVYTKNSTTNPGYKITTNYRTSGGSTDITGDYYSKFTADNQILNIGNNLSAHFIPLQSTYNAGAKLSLSYVELKDGEATLTGLSTGDYTISSISVMHGSSIMKTYSGNTIPTTLVGECTIRLQLSSPFPGKVETTSSTLMVNNPSIQRLGDINLDGITDIFDLVLISKDFGKVRGVSLDWDGRCNLHSADNVIDLLDLAIAAQHYGK
jgi:hypothetical protein